jgi:hypothetical protein
MLALAVWLTTGIAHAQTPAQPADDQKPRLELYGHLMLDTGFPFQVQLLGFSARPVIAPIRPPGSKVVLDIRLAGRGKNHFSDAAEGEDVSRDRATLKR